MVAGPGGWSRAAGRFLNSSPAGAQLPVRAENKQQAPCLPVTHALGLAQPGQREIVKSQGQRGRDGKSDRDGKSQRENDVKRRRWEAKTVRGRSRERQQ